MRKSRDEGGATYEGLCKLHPELAVYLHELHSAFQLGVTLATGRPLPKLVASVLSAMSAKNYLLSRISRQRDQPNFRRVADHSNQHSAEGEIGLGSMATVLRVKDQDPSRSIAMKVMHLSKEFSQPLSLLRRAGANDLIADG